ncbi:myotubularin-related protein 3-like isoform X2 [Acanthaster planci]|uniref:phosphatidylinositol-3,5-bisphosphate 3-phosphatase n=1 Tax=Acanthaster planci TaxID=133434 RepID=A0A8B7YUZ9_ACAPL|nr:myotubularin-related protein 3-like isoform X2 [Acanthaster planci]
MFWIAESRGNLDMADQEEGDSLVCLQSSEAFPLKPMVKDDPRLEVPYHQLCGESVTYLGTASDAVIVLSSYRLLIRHKESFVNVPVMLIESVECRDLFYLVILCKDGKTYRCKFATNEQCQDWLTRLMSAIAPPSKLEDLFAFAFHAWCFDQIHHDGDTPAPGIGFLQSAGDIPTYSFNSEVRRQGFDMKEAWRVFENKDYKYSSSYPVQHIVPAWVTDEDLKAVSSFRASRRFPSVVWRHQRNGAVIARCSQPEIGWFGWRCSQDERFMENILRACNMDSPQSTAQATENTANGTAGGEASDVSILPHLGSNPSNKKVLIVDARSYTAAYANRAKGGGCEFPEYYPSCDIQFMGLANIHSIRKSFQGVRTICSNTPDGTNWLSLLEATKWLQHLSLLLKSALMVVSTVDKEACPVVVHCSDGWDRTPQIVALAELMLDPYYRTLEGFQVLVEREWLDFGHKFGDRCGHKPNDDDVNQRCPVFLQWLDCVHQLIKQYPTAFEFNETFLVKLVQHTYSCLFGTFLCNSAQQRAKHSIKDRTCSVWALLGVEGHKYRNFLFASSTELILYPCCHVRTMHFWTAVFLSDSTPATCDDNSSLLQTAQTATGEGAKLTRTRSVDDLHKGEEENRRGSIVEGSPLVRRLSDPNLSELKLDGGRIGTPPQTRKLADRPLGGAVMRGEGDESDPSLDANASTSADEPVTADFQDGNNPNEDSATSNEEEVNSEPLTNGHANGLLNGDCSDSDPDDAPLDENSRTSTPKRCQGSGHSRQSVEGIMNGSTDTLTEDSSSRDGNSDNNHWHECNGHTDTSDVEDENAVLELRAESDNAAHNSLSSGSKQMGKSISISTSTSDLTSSAVGSRLPDLNGTLFISGSTSLPELGIQTSMPNGDSQHVRYISSSSIPNFVSAPSSPVSSESQSCLTPNELEVFPLKGSASGLKVGRHFDEDGLTPIAAPEQDRLLGIMHKHQNEVAILRQEIIRLQKLLQQTSQMKALIPNATLNGVVASELEDEKDRDASSRCGSITSDISWEQVDETETKRTLWIPDHAVTHCFKCNTQFNVVYRKHHCRSCGQVFCSTCTSYTAPIPQEQLYQPERVCKACYDMLERNNSRKTQMAPGLG